MRKRLIATGILLGLFMALVILFGQGCRKTIGPSPPAKAPKVIKTKSGIEKLVAARFPRPDVLGLRPSLVRCGASRRRFLVFACGEKRVDGPGWYR